MSGAQAEPKPDRERCGFCSSDDIDERRPGTVECVSCNAIALRRGPDLEWISPTARIEMRQAFEAERHPVEAAD